MNDHAPGKRTAVSEYWHYPGDPKVCPELRHRTRDVLAAFPHLVDAAELVMSELFANACRHTRSGDPGGATAISVSALRTGLVLLSVADQGPKRDPHTKRPRFPHIGPLDPFTGTGRGLRLVAHLTDDWGHWATSTGGHTVWALFAPPPPAFIALPC